MTKKQFAEYDRRRDTPKRGAFVAPVLDGDGTITYVTMPGGAPVAEGQVVFTGVDVTAEAFLERMAASGLPTTTAGQRELVGEFLAAVAGVKVGGVVAFVPGAELRLEPRPRSRVGEEKKA